MHFGRSHTYIYSCLLGIGLPKLHVSAKCENRAKESLQAVLSGDNIINLTVSLCLIEIFSEFQGQTGGILICVAGFTAATVADTAAHQGACQGLALRVSL